MTHQIYNFFELSAAFDLKPEQAIQYFQQKGIKASFSWMDMIGEEHDAAVTVAKMMDTNLLSYVDKQVDKMLETGDTLADFKRALIPKLQKAGWWGKQDVVDPLTGKVIKAQLGSATRLENIFRTNLQSAYAVGQWQSIQANSQAAPFLMYDAVEDHRTRPEHQQWNGTARPVDDPFWQTHYPPNGWNCRCGVIQLTKAEMERHKIPLSPKPTIKKRLWINPRTGKATTVPVDLDPGWDHNPGKARMDKLRQLEKEKALQLKPGMQRALKQGVQAAKQAKQKYLTQLAANTALKKLGQASVDGTFIAQKQKTIQKAAQHQLDTAIAEKTPYLSNAIKQLQKQKGSASLTPKELLDSAKAKAESIKQSVLINQYKKAIIDGKAPNSNALAAYHQLPEEAQKAIDQSIELKTGQLQAKETLKDIKENPKGQTLKNQILIKLEKSGNTDDLTPVQLLKKVEEQYQVEQLKKETAAKLSGYKKKVLAGKLPTPGQQAAFNTLDEEAKEKFLAKLDKAKQGAIQPVAEPHNTSDFPIPTTDHTTKQKVAQNPAATTTEPKNEAPQWSDLTKIGNQKGSNPGGFYQDTTTGKKYYIKEPASEDIARNEVLAAKLYEAAGVDVPNVYLLQDGKQIRIASEIIDGLQQDAAQLTSGKLQGIRDNFMVDAWLANWDVVGLSYDNLLVKGSKAIHIDTGGALRYRAQGGLKGDAFGKKVLEIESLRDSAMNPQSAAVFASVTREDMIAGARKALALDKQQITELVESVGPTTKRERTRLINILVARQQDIAKQYPEALQKATPEPTISGSAINRLEYEQVVNSRSNGYTIPTDKGDIEDHNVLLYHKKNLQGMDVTGAYFKLMPSAMRKLEQTIGTIESTAEPYEDMHKKIITAIKSVAHRAENGYGMDDYVFERIDAAVERWQQVLDEMTEQASNNLRSSRDLAAFTNRTQPFIDELRKVRHNTLEGEIPNWNAKVGRYKTFSIPPAASVKQSSGIQWTEDSTEFQLSNFQKGRQREGKKTFTLSARRYTAEVDGATIHYWPKHHSVPFSLQGRMEIDVTGIQQADTERVFSVMDELGINSQRTTTGDMEELYLDKLAYIHKLDKVLANETRSLTDQGERIRKKLARMNKALGIDLKSMKQYNPAGEYQAFGQGQRIHYRPELLNDPAFKDLNDNYRVIHVNSDNGSMIKTLKKVLESGGQMVSTTEKIRRGIRPGGKSYQADLHSGGANYFFTRIKPKGDAINTEGFIWNSKAAARMDAISYSHDYYGRTTDTHVQQHRKITVSQLREISRLGGNETIFKNSLSIFDDLESIRIDSLDERQNVIQLFKDAGYQQWPDGRPLEQVIKRRGEDE
ncbi:phage minor head protein [Endozoicomonas atrinae]|uniref:phage head morphogenesis protein n=1 Tax=Endozoicomonas atrinae TaxID=1333660 RepID=UPI0008240CE8|nr:phage minor head protein [Endozoicomonas atrinae]